MIREGNLAVWVQPQRLCGREPAGPSGYHLLRQGRMQDGSRGEHTRHNFCAETRLPADVEEGTEARGGDAELGIPALHRARPTERPGP